MTRERKALADPPRGRSVEQFESQGSELSEPEEKLRTDIENYYWAVERQDWDYTYEHLYAKSQKPFTREEWAEKNQWVAENPQRATLSSMKIQGKDIYTEGTDYFAKIDRSFSDGTSLTSVTFFTFDGKDYKHELSQEELDFFMPGTTLETFVKDKVNPGPQGYTTPESSAPSNDVPSNKTPNYTTANEIKDSAENGAKITEVHVSTSARSYEDLKLIADDLSSKYWANDILILDFYHHVNDETHGIALIVNSELGAEAANATGLEAAGARQDDSTYIWTEEDIEEDPSVLKLV